MFQILKKITTQKSGLSLLEIIFYIGIFITGMFIVMRFIMQNYQTLRFANELNDAVRSGQKGINTMVKEIREARTGDNGTYALVFAGDQEFIFYSDIDQDDETEWVRYFLDETNFKKGVVEPTGDPISYPLETEVITTVSQYVQNESNPIFYYYNGDWPGDTENNPLPTPSRLVETKLMRVYLKINVQPERIPSPFELESYTQIRNLKTNL